MESNEEYHDPDYPEVPVSVKEEPPCVAQEEKVEKIKSIIRREFQNELEARQSEVVLIDQRMSSSRRLLHRLRYALVSNYYNDLKLKLSNAQVEDEIAAIKDPKSKAEISTLLREGQRNIHPSVKKLLGKKEVDISEIFKSRAPRNKSKKDYSAMLQKRNYTISADSTKTLRPNMEIKTEPAAETSRPKKIPRALKPSATVLTLDEGTRNQMKHRYRIVIGNTSKYTPAASRSDRSTHKWLLYARGPPQHPDISRVVTAVTVKLHHSYAPHHTVHLSKPPYHITRRGWGEFPAKIELHFAQPQLNRPALVQHTIKLDTDCTGLQTLGGETLVDVWLYSTEEMLKYEYKEDTQTDEQNEPTPELIQPKTEPVEDVDSQASCQTDNWLEFFSNEHKDTSFDVDEMIIKPEKKAELDINYYDSELVVKTEPPEPQTWTDPCERLNEFPDEILKKPNLPKKRIVKYMEPTTGKIYYLEMDRTLDLSKVQEIVINNKTAKISPIKSNGLKSVRNRKHGVSLLKPKLSANKVNDYSHIQNDHCYLATPLCNVAGVKKEHSLYEFLCSSMNKFDCVRTAVSFLVKRIPLVSEDARDPDFLKNFPFVVDNYELFWKMDFAKRRNIEWSRAKLINKILSEHFINNETIWRTKQILIYSRLHGYYPIRKDCLNDRSETSDDNERLTSDVKTLSIFDPELYSCQNEVLNLTGSDDEIDVVNCQSPVKVKVELPCEEVLTVLPVENEDDRLRYFYIEKKCADIGIDLRCEDIGNGYSYSAVHAVLLSAVRSVADELLRGALAHSLARTNTAWPGSSHRRERVSCGAVAAGAVAGAVRALGVAEAGLRAVLGRRVLAAGHDLVTKQHSLVDAHYTRLALAKAAYDRLFTWIVQQINKAIDVPAGTYKNTLIGVLDIYGFEIFETNSFEQFCINYCNEKLQQLFIELVLKQEQEEYAREGIQWTPVQYFNNRIICELIDAPHHGVIAIMDEACLNPTQITDQQLLEAMDKRLTGHRHYTSRQLAPTDKKLKHGVDFKITHYAGDVTYAITGFMDKNKDSLWQDLKRLLHSSSNASLAAMWPEGAADIQKTSRRPPSAASLFRSSLAALVAGLHSKEPFYVRCLKPNPLQAPSTWDPLLVQHQTAYLGLVENVRVRRAGFACRVRYDRFVQRYKMLSQYTWPNYRGHSPRDAAAVLLRDLHLDDVHYGHTKLFIRSAKTLQSLEAARAELIPSIVVLLQKLWRGAIARRRYKKMKAALTIFNAWKRYRYRRYISELQTELSRHRGVIRRWPPAPRGLDPALLVAAYRRWRAYLVLRAVPRERWAELRLKVCCGAALRGRRRHWGAARPWRGDYLAAPDYNEKAGAYRAQIASMQKAGQIDKPLFSCRIHKFNRYNKSSERCLLVTSTAIYKLDSNSFKPLKKPTYIKDVGAVRVMSSDVQLVVLCVPSAKNDLVAALEAPGDDLVGELLGVLASRYCMLSGGELCVEVESGASTRCTLGGRSRALQLPAHADPRAPAFTHAHNVITYHPPSARA